MTQATEQAGGLEHWADVLESHKPENSAKGILMLRAAAKTLRELAPKLREARLEREDKRDRDTELPFILSEAQRKQTHQILTWYQYDRERGYGEPKIGPMTRPEVAELRDLIECFEGVSS